MFKAFPFLKSLLSTSGFISISPIPFALGIVTFLDSSTEYPFIEAVSGLSEIDTTLLSLLPFTGATNLTKFLFGNITSSDDDIKFLCILIGINSSSLPFTLYVGILNLKVFSSYPFESFKE